MPVEEPPEEEPSKEMPASPAPNPIEEFVLPFYERDQTGYCGHISLSEASVGYDAAIAEFEREMAEAVDPFRVEWRPLGQVTDALGAGVPWDFWAVFRFRTDLGFTSSGAYGFVDDHGNSYHVRWCPD